MDDDAAVRKAYREILAPTERNYLSDRDRFFGGLEAKTPALPYRIGEAKDGIGAIQMVQAAMDVDKPLSPAFVDMKPKAAPCFWMKRVTNSLINVEI